MTLDPPRTSLPVADEDAGIRGAFERLQRSGELIPHAVRVHIDESWRRCYQAGIDPARLPGPVSRTDKMRRVMSPDDHELLDVSMPVMTQATQVLAGSETILVISDARGTVLATDG